MSASAAIPIAWEALTSIYPIPSPEQLRGGSASLLLVKTIDSVSMGSYFGKSYYRIIVPLREFGETKTEEGNCKWKTAEGRCR